MQRNRPPSAQTIKVLRALAADPAQWRYGYELGTEVRLKSGSLYPILVRLADRGLLETSWEPAVGSRPPRHLYRLTMTGREYRGGMDRAASSGPSPARPTVCVRRRAMIIIPVMLLGIVVALLRRTPHAVVDGPTQDVPMRLLRWTAGLLPAPRDEWGRAMLGELDHIEGRGRRWRFTIGCVGATLLLPPRGRAGAGVLAMVAVATGSLGLYASVVIRYRLGAGDWVGAAIALDVPGQLHPRRQRAAAPPRCRRSRIAGRSVRRPGLAGDVRVHLLRGHRSDHGAVGHAAVVIVVPAVVGVAGTLWGGSAVVGRRTARLAAISAGVGLFLFGTLAVAALGAGGPPDDSGFTVGYIVSDRLGNNIIFDLVLVPLVTATIGWAAAAATARIRPRLATNGDTVPFTAAGRLEPMTRPETVKSAVPVQHRRATVRPVLVCAAVAAAVLLAAGKLVAGLTQLHRFDAPGEGSNSPRPAKSGRRLAPTRTAR